MAGLTKIFKNPGAVFSLQVHLGGLARGWHARSVHHTGWASFFALLTYKAESAGREVVKADPRGTSQTCTCGAPVPETLNLHWHHCPA
jgi:putative transposase